MSTNQSESNHSRQSDQSDYHQPMETFNPNLASASVIPDSHRPKEVQQTETQISVSDFEHLTANVSSDAQETNYPITEADPYKADTFHVMPASHSDYPNQAEIIDSDMRLDTQESNSFAIPDKSAPDPLSSSENSTLSSFHNDTVIPQSSESSASFIALGGEELMNTRNSDDGITVGVSTVSQQAQISKSVTSSDNKMYNINTQVQDLSITCQSNADTSSQAGNVEWNTSKLNPVQTWSQHQNHQVQGTFIGPIKPSVPQEYAATEESMEVNAPTINNPGESYNFTNRSVPAFVTWVSTEYLRSSSENFLRGCKWSPDGSQLLTNSNDNILRVFNTSDAVLDNENASDIEQISEVVMRESRTVYDYAWFPSMESRQPDTCRIATTCSGIPIHLWDSAQGKIVASYKAFDQYDEVTAAYSLSFSSSGSRVFGGYKKAVRVFDTEYPGRKCRLLKTCGPKKSSSQPGQTGIISCFAHNPSCEGSFAAGSYTRYIGLYDLRCDGATCVIEGQRGGITHLMFTPDGNKLLSGARKDNEILCWDMRNLGTVCFSALRDVRTNQRMYFDITRSGCHMTSGNDDGTVTFWDLRRETDVIDGRAYLKPEAQFQAHRDSVNGVSFYPSGEFLATASGQRHFQDFGKLDSSDSEEDDDDDGNDRENTVTKDFSIRIWRMPLARDCAG